MDREGYPAQDLLDYAVSSDDDDVDIDVLEDDEVDRMDDFRDEYMLMVVGEGARNSRTTKYAADRRLHKHENNDNGTEVERSISSKSGVVDLHEDEEGSSKLVMEGDGLIDNTNHLQAFSSEGGKQSESVSVAGEEIETFSNTSEENEIESVDPFPIIVVTSAQSGRTVSRVSSSKQTVVVEEAVTEEDADRCGVLVDTVRSDDLNDINVQNEVENTRTSSNTPLSLKNSSTSNSPSTVVSPTTSAQEDTEQQKQEQSMQSEEVGVGADITTVDGVNTKVETDDGIHQTSVHEEEGKKLEVDEIGDVAETEPSSVKGTMVEEGDVLEEDGTHESHADDLAGTDSHTKVDVENHDGDHDVQDVLNEMITRVEDEMCTGRSSSSPSPSVDVTTTLEPEGDDAVSGNQEGEGEEDAGDVKDTNSNMREEVLNAIVHEVLSRPGSGVDIQNDIQQATQEYLKGNTLLF